MNYSGYADLSAEVQQMARTPLVLTDTEKPKGSPVVPPRSKEVGFAGAFSLVTFFRQAKKVTDRISITKDLSFLNINRETTIHSR